MSQLDHFHSVRGEGEPQLIDQELSADVQGLSLAFVKMHIETETTAASDIGKYVAKDLVHSGIQNIQGKGLNDQLTGYDHADGALRRLWNSVTDSISDHAQKRSLIDIPSSEPQDPILLQEILSHMNSLLQSNLFTFSELEKKRILEEAEHMAKQQGLFSLGLLLFLIDRQPKELMCFVETPGFSKEQLYLWVKQEGRKTLQREIEESMKHESLSPMSDSEQLAKTMASVLITHVGLCNSGLLEDVSGLLSFDLPSPHFSNGELCELLKSRLQLLRNVSALRQKVESLKTPEGVSPGVECIRATWNISQDQPITYQDARKTLLATFLSHLRQQQRQEDCFAMALIISVMEESPEQAMEDLSSLLFQGSLKRKIDGKDVIFPWLYVEYAKESLLPLQNAWKQVVASMSETPRQGFCVEKFDAAVMPIFQALGADQTSLLTSTVQVLLRDSFRWIYEPSMLTQAGSQGAFLLYHLQGEQWNKITTVEGLITALEVFVKEKWPEEEDRLKKQELIHAQLYTEGVALALINRYREAFELAPALKDADYSKLHCAPWITYTRGNTEFVWRTYCEEKSAAEESSLVKPLSIVPKKGEQLVSLLVDWLNWHVKYHHTLQPSHRPVVRIEDVHSFDLLLAPSLLEISKGSRAPEEWIHQHLKKPLLPLSQARPSPFFSQKLARFVSQNLLTRENAMDGQKELSLLDSRLSLHALRNRLCDIALQGRKGDLQQAREEIENKIDSRILQLLSPEEKKLLESHALIIGDSNWGDERGRNRYFYLAMHPGSKELALFLGDVDRGDHEPLHFILLPNQPWLSKRWQLLDTHERVNAN